MSGRYYTTSPALMHDILGQMHHRMDGTRKLIAITGPPASGKSTLARSLRNSLRLVGAQAETVPMDGYHLDNRLLDARGLRARKGAPETYDAHGHKPENARTRAQSNDLVNARRIVVARLASDLSVADQDMSAPDV